MIDALQELGVRMVESLQACDVERRKKIAAHHQRRRAAASDCEVIVPLPNGRMIPVVLTEPSPSVVITLPPLAPCRYCTGSIAAGAMRCDSCGGPRSGGAKSLRPVRPKPQPDPIKMLLE